MRQVCFKILISLVILIGCFFVLKSSYVYIQRNMFDVEEPFYGQVTAVEKGTVVVLDRNKAVALAGVEIVDSEDDLNYIPDLEDSLRKLVIGKNVKVEIVERKREGSYVNYDFVKVYLKDGTCVNDYLLENGLAFFDNGHYRGYEDFRKKEQLAKKNEKGLWKHKDRLILLYVGATDLEETHYPECPKAKEIQGDNRIEYYTRPPAVHWYRDWYPFGCKYCDEIKKTKPENLK